MDYGATYLTAKKTKIKSVSKQSKFEGSDREVRGWIVKQLVNNKTGPRHYEERAK
jgi:A/G-specific adenine glycosylase